MRGKVSPAEVCMQSLGMHNMSRQALFTDTHKQGLVARIVDWGTGADSHHGRRARMGTTNGPRDFTVLADDPDRRRLGGEALAAGPPGSRM